jgi:acyl-CoA thioesterase-1
MIAKSVSMLLSFSILMPALTTGCGPNKPRTSASPAAQTQVSEASSFDKSSDQASASSAQMVKRDTRPVIVAFGDSLTAGYGTSAGESYPDYLQEDLNARGYRYRVINEGISGNTSKDGVMRVAQIVALHPAITIVAFGGNDGLRGIEIADTEKNLSTILSTLQKSHIKVVLGGITLPPNYGSAYIAKFDAMYAKLAKTYHVPLLPFMLQGVYGTPGDMQNDDTHATARGNRKVAKNFVPLLLPLLHTSSTK